MYNELLNALKIFLLTCGIILMAGCSSFGTASNKMPVENIMVETKYAPEIAILKNKELKFNSPEKYHAAKKLAEELDFSYLRNVKTLDNIFGASDAHTDTTGTQRIIYILYKFEAQSVGFKVWAHENVVTKCVVEVKNDDSFWSF